MFFLWSVCFTAEFDGLVGDFFPGFRSFFSLMIELCTGRGLKTGADAETKPTTLHTSGFFLAYY